jgi:hypothetical protein
MLGSILGGNRQCGVDAWMEMKGHFFAVYLRTSVRSPSGAELEEEGGSERGKAREREGEQRKAKDI